MQQQQKRSLEVFVRGLGGVFLRRALPGVPWYGLLVLLSVAAMLVGAQWRLAVASAALLVGAWMLGTMGRRRYRWACWQVAAVLVLAVLQPGWSGLDEVLVARLTAGAVGVSLLQVVFNSLRLFAFSRRLQRVAEAMPDTRVLELLPPEAADKVRAWQHGDDTFVVELGEVVALVVLFASLQETGGSRELRGPAYAWRDLGR